MKYTSPIYNNEMIETSDVICESPFKIANINKVVGKDENGEDIVAPATQIIVDIGNLL